MPYRRIVQGYLVAAPANSGAHARAICAGSFAHPLTFIQRVRNLSGEPIEGGKSLET